MEVNKSKFLKALVEVIVKEQGIVATPTAGSQPTSQSLPDVDRLNNTLEKSPSIKAAVKYINTRPELVKAIASIMKLVGKELQPGKISVGTALTDLRTALKSAGYK